MLRRPKVVLVAILAMLAFTGAAVVMQTSSSSTPSQLSWGATLTCVADANGYCTVNHPVGVVPDSVTITPELPAIVSVDRKTATSFRVRFVRAVSSGTAVTPLSGTRVFNVHIDYTSASPSPSGPVSLSPSVTTSPVSAGWPSAANAGVPAGTVLVVVNGNQTITTAGTVIDGKDIRGCVDVRAPGVIIRRSKVACGSFYVVGSFGGTYSGTGLVVEDSELDCLNTGGTGMGDTNFTARRLDIHSCENGFDIDGPADIQDSYIHDLFNTATTHTDGAQLTDIAHSVTIRHNTILAGSGTSAIISPAVSRGVAKDITIDHNLMAGGAYTLYCEQSGPGNSYQVTDNHFSRQFYVTGGAFGPWTDCQDEAVVTGNVWDDTGLPIS